MSDVRDVSLVTMAWHHASGGAIRSQAWQHFDNSAGINGEILVRQMNHWRVQYCSMMINLGWFTKANKVKTV